MDGNPSAGRLLPGARRPWFLMIDEQAEALKHRNVIDVNRIVIDVIFI
jgi:hypothetical protein